MASAPQAKYPSHRKRKRRALKFHRIAELRDAVSRQQLTMVIAVLLPAFLAGSAVYGMWIGSFAALNDVWIAVGPIVGALIGYYFALRDN